MSVRRVTLIVGLAIYGLLWLLALNGATSLVEPLAVPLVLAVMIALGVRLNHYLGLPPRRSHFRDSDDEGA